MQLKPVYLFDGVPLGLSYDLGVKFTGHGGKLIVAVKSPDGKWEHEFVRQIRKTNGDAFSVDPSDKTEAGFKLMLDKGLSRYGRVNHVLFFRKAKAETEEAFKAELTERLLPALSGLRSVYDSFLNERGESYKSWLILTASFINDPSIMKEHSDDQFHVLSMPEPTKTKPFILSDSESDGASIQWLLSVIGTTGSV